MEDLKVSYDFVVVIVTEKDIRNDPRYAVIVNDKKKSLSDRMDSVFDLTGLIAKDKIEKVNSQGEVKIVIDNYDDFSVETSSDADKQCDGNYPWKMLIKPKK